MPHRLLRDPGLPVSDPTTSYWQTPPRLGLLNVQSPNLPTPRDVVIIGSGVTGLSVSWWLLKEVETFSVTVIEAREICSGATGRNGGRINTPAVQDYAKYRCIYDDKTAASIVNFELAHYDAIRGVVEGLGAEALRESEIRTVEAIATAFTTERVAELWQQLRDFEEAFPHLKGQWRIADQDEVTKSFGITNAKGALVGAAGAVWPYRLFTYIYAHLLSRHKERFSLEANTPALEIKKQPLSEYPYLVRTPRGIIQAKHVIHCTEGHAAHLLPQLRGVLVPRRGQMTVQNPGSGFPQRGERSWNFYINNMDYATQNPYTGEIFLGGGDVAGYGPSLGIASDAEQSVGALSHLGGLLPAAFGSQGWGSEVPGRPRLKAAWTGIMCNSLDHLPLVGPLPPKTLDSSGVKAESGEWISAGYGGYGMVNAFLCGKAVAHMIQGKDVSSWFPEKFFLTPTRLANLHAKLDRMAGSEHQHLLALL